MNKKIKKVLAACITILASVAVVTVPAFGATSDVSSAIIQSYSSDPSVVAGMVVGLKPKTKNTVVPLSATSGRNMLGVVVPANNAFITLTPQSSPAQQVLVATSGRYQVLVSNQNGAIKSGDYLTISSLDGIAMRASTQQQYVIGRAADNYAKNSPAISTASVKDTFGHTIPASIGRIAVDLRLGPNPAYQQSTSLPGAVTKTATSIANKPVTLVQIYLSLALLILTFFITGTILYSGVRNGIISIGRNPLSKNSLVFALFKVLLIGLFILGAGVAAAFLALRL